MPSKITDKKQVVFLHGYLSNGESFNYIRKKLSPYYECYAPDLKGFGENTNMSYPYSLDDYADELYGYLEKEKIFNPIVVAHSFGARVAVKFCGERYRETRPFSKLVLTGPAGLKPRFSLKKFAKKRTYKLLKRFLSDKAKAKFFSPDYLAVDGVMRESFKLVVNENLKGIAKNIVVPTLIVEGSLDGETPLYMARRYNRLIKGSQLKIIDNAGHFAFIDKRDYFSQILLEFISGNYRRDYDD